MFSIKAMTKIVDYVKNQLHTIKSATTKARTLAVRAQLFLIQKIVNNPRLLARYEPSSLTTKELHVKT